MLLLLCLKVNVEIADSNAEEKRYKCCNVIRTRGAKGFCKKFFWEGNLMIHYHTVFCLFSPTYDIVYREALMWNELKEDYLSYVSVKKR